MKIAKTKKARVTSKGLKGKRKLGRGIARVTKLKKAAVKRTANRKGRPARSIAAGL